MKRSLFFALILLTGSYSGMAHAATSEYVGTTLNWFEPTNWSTGSVPDATTDVVIVGAQVELDPALGAGPVEVRDISLENSATLTLLPGTDLTYNDMTITDSQLYTQSSELSGDEMTTATSTAPNGEGQGGPTFNPTTNDNRSIKITVGTASFGLGGDVPASTGNTGAGFYATIVTDEAELGAELELELFYGFTPSVGDSFQIITVADSLTGIFAGLPEGATAASFGSVDLLISYAGGDGNDVVLTAANAGPTPGLPVAGGAGLLVMAGLLATFGAARHRGH